MPCLSTFRELIQWLQNVSCRASQIISVQTIEIDRVSLQLLKTPVQFFEDLDLVRTLDLFGCKIPTSTFGADYDILAHPLFL